jgi:threonine dehydrogenase-like Zn-dependent dehydrogenase
MPSASTRNHRARDQRPKPPAPRSSAEERKQIAPETNPDGRLWQPGKAPSLVLQWAVQSVAKAGTIALIGVYPPTAITFPIGMAMNKNLTLKMGNCNHRKYIPHLVDLVRSGTVTPEDILTKVEPMAPVLEAYKAFDLRQPGWMKVELRP